MFINMWDALTEMSRQQKLAASNGCTDCGQAIKEDDARIYGLTKNLEWRAAHDTCNLPVDTSFNTYENPGALRKLLVR